MFSSFCAFTPELTLRETCAQKGGMFPPSFKFVFASPSGKKMYTNQLYARDFRVETLTVKDMHFVERNF